MKNNYLKFYKRIIDIILSAISLLILAPLFILIIVLIEVEKIGPSIYKSQRVGMFSRNFNMYKFRTMRMNAPEVASDLLEDPEKYITRIGRILRKASLDELPQLVNILQGSMSIVGPRPALYNQHDLIKLRKDCGVDNLKPGLTGLAQIYGRDELNSENKCKFDKAYLENISFYLDLKIIILTIIKVVKGSGVSH